jgi:hypothetical protein
MQLLTALFAIFVAAMPLAAAADRDLLGSMTPEQLAHADVRDASMYLDRKAHSLTITFDYSSGEPEVRLPARALGWPADWSSFRAVEFLFHAGSLEPVAIGFSDGNQTKLFRIEPLPGIRIRGVIPFDTFVQTRTMTPLLPLGYKVWPDRLFTFEKVKEVIFRMRYPNQPSQLTLFSFTLREKVPADDIIERRPAIDRYGQWIPETWENKATSDAGLSDMWRDDVREPASYPSCPLGGDSSRPGKGTGFFRVDKVDGRWVLVDPHGHPFFSAGMDLVDPVASSFATDVSRREFLFQELPPYGDAWLTPGKVVSFYVANLIRRFGTGWRDKYADHITGRLKSWGFNTIANWSDTNLAIRSGMPYVVPLSGWTTRKVFPFPYDFPDIFSAEFERNVDDAARRQCAPLKNDPNLIGWFVGNEPHWARSFGALKTWPEILLSDPEPTATKARLQQMLAEDKSGGATVRDDFLYECARKYFETVTAAIRRHDPNHLVLGIRFAERPADRWAELSRMFDAFSINIYSDDFAPDPQMIQHYSEVSGKPVIIGEFTACAPGRGLQGLFYFVHKVRDQAERGTAYRYYVENSAASPFIVGTHWFQMVDDLPTGRPGDQERLNYGFINVLDLPYRDLVNAAKETHRRLYDLKFGKVQPFNRKPRTN